MHHASAAAGCGQAAGVPRAIWEWISLSEVWVCAGAAAELREVAGDVLSGVPGALRQHGAVYGEGGRGAGLP